MCWDWENIIIVMNDSATQSKQTPQLNLILILIFLPANVIFIFILSISIFTVFVLIHCPDLLWNGGFQTFFIEKPQSFTQTSVKN